MRSTARITAEARSQRFFVSGFSLLRQQRDEVLLDRYEGYPYYYGKVQIPVELDGKTVSAMAYVMQPGFACNKPSPSYLHTIREWYQAAGFDQAVLDQALEDTRQGDGAESRDEGTNYVVTPLAICPSPWYIFRKEPR